MGTPTMGLSRRHTFPLFFPILSSFDQRQQLGAALSSVEPESDPAEHAIYSSVLHTPLTVTVLVRVLHAGLIVAHVPVHTTITSSIRLSFACSLVSNHLSMGIGRDTFNCRYNHRFTFSSPFLLVAILTYGAISPRTYDGPRSTS